MAQIFTALLLTSGIGTALALILTLLKPITRKVFSGGWHYYMWLVVLLVMVLPIRLNLPEKSVTTPPISETVTITDNQIENTETPIIIETQPEKIIQEQTTQPEKVSTVQVIKDFLNGKVLLFSLIWLMGAVLLFLIKILSYLVFLIKIHRHSEFISCPEVKEYTNRKIKTRVSDTICSPLMIGIIRPTLLLPKTNITPEQLHNVLAHEMTHLKRNDILYKWFVSIVKCVHWFNPAIYLISKQINIDCEISCDLAVVKEMNEQQEKGYVETILSLLTHNNSKAIPLTTGMTGNKKTLKRRFTMIKNKIKVSKKVAVISGILAVVVLLTAVLTSGLLNGMFIKEQPEQLKETIKLTNNGELLVFENKPIIENDMVYFPLEELLKKANTNNYVEINNEEISIYIERDKENPNQDYYIIKVGKKEITYTPIEPAINGMGILETKYAPILRNDLVYIPYEYVRYILINNGYKISGSSLYQNEKMNVQFEIPLDWLGKYFIDENTEDWLFFNQTATYNKYGEGTGRLFYLHKVNDKDLEEELLIGNQTVLWQNEEYAYVLGRPTDIQYPVWSDRDSEDILFAEEYQEMFSGITHIEQTFSLINKVDTPVIRNAENLSFAQIKDLQRQVDNGHFPWRLEPSEVIRAFLSGKGISSNIIRVPENIGTTLKYVEGNIEIELFKPIDKSEKGIWIVKSYNVNNTFSEEEIQSAKSVVEKYFKAKNERNRSAVLSTLTEWHNAPNVILWQDEKITVNNISINPNDQMRADYVQTGRGSVNNTAMENVIVFRVDYTVSIPQGGKSAYENGDYKNYGIILVRDSKNSQWLIDDMGY